MSKTKAKTSKPAAAKPAAVAPVSTPATAPQAHIVDLPHLTTVALGASTTPAPRQPPTAYLVTTTREFQRSRDVNSRTRRRTVAAGTPDAVTYTFSATPVRVPAPLPAEIAADPFLVAVPVPSLKSERLQ